MRSSSGKADDLRDLVDRALRALGDAKLGRSEFALLRGQLLWQVDTSRRLRAKDIDLWDDLRQRVTALGRDQRSFGLPPFGLVFFLAEIVDRADIDDRTKLEVRDDVVQWGVAAYYAA